MKNRNVHFIALLLLLTGLSACSGNQGTLGEVLFKEFRNRELKDIRGDSVAILIEKQLKEKSGAQQPLITTFYRARGYQPVLLKNHVPQGGIQALLERLKAAGEHGLAPALFQTERLGRLLDSIQDKKVNGSTAAALVASLELQVAASLATYGTALEFGFTDPAEILPRYYIATKRPDSSSLARLFETADLKATLDSIQPAGAQYKALRQALAGARSKGPGTSNGDTTLDAREKQRALIVNLERLRWKNKPDTGKYVLVNIADFRLHVMESGNSSLHMKVCVGEPAQRWQTPQLNSVIERVQVNPIWNIPESIASNEIVQKAANDPYYLENANINVYKNGKKIEDSREIDWSKVSREQMPYTFKQRPGSQNALGKIKFLFDNQSSVYLHDTPAKAAFNTEMRAISHGCVRVEKPLELAYALFGKGNKFELIKTEMGKEDPEARYVELGDKVPVYLTYFTCWQEKDGNIRYRPDVYGLDSVIFSHLQPQGSAPLAAH